MDNDSKNEELKPPVNPTHFGSADDGGTHATAQRDEASRYQPFVTLGFLEDGTPIADFGDLELTDVEYLLAFAKVEFLAQRNAALLQMQQDMQAGSERVDQKGTSVNA